MEIEIENVHRKYELPKQLKREVIVTKRWFTLNVNIALLIVIGLSIGTTYITLPFAIRLLGILPWIFSMISVVFINVVCTRFMSVPTLHLRTYHKYPDDVGLLFRKLSIIAVYTNNISGGVSFIMLSSNVLKYLVPIGTLSDLNVVRLWAMIIVSCITVIMHSDIYSNFKTPVIIAVTTSIVSFISIIINCFIAQLFFDIRLEILAVQYIKVNESYFLPLGAVVAFLTCAVVIIANIVVLSRPKKFTISINGGIVILLIFYLISGLVAYCIFGKFFPITIFSSFWDIIKKDDIIGMGFKVLFNVITISVQVYMIMHFLMASLLVLSPCCLHMEEMFQISHDTNWKRVGVRTCFMLIILVICCLMPGNEVIMHIAGAIPLTLMGMIFPFVIFLKVFTLINLEEICICFLISISGIIFVVNL